MRVMVAMGDSSRMLRRMRLCILLVSGLVGVTLSTGCKLGGGCSDDNDCKGDRVCSAGECVSLPAPPAALQPEPAPPPIEPKPATPSTAVSKPVPPPKKPGLVRIPYPCPGGSAVSDGVSCQCAMRNANPCGDRLVRSETAGDDTCVFYCKP